MCVQQTVRRTVPLRWSSREIFMRHTPLFRAVTLATLLAVTSSCVSTQLPPVSASGGAFEPLPDEAELWDQARDEEEQLLGKVTLYEDPLLESYLEDVVVRLNPPGMAANPEIRYRVRVVEDPTLNAFAYPHGSLYVHTGLLARMENEDQLATVLAHEMTHVENRHMLRYQRSARNKQVGLMVAAVAAAVIAADAEWDALSDGNWAKAATIDVVSDLIIGLGLQLAFLASINGYGRGLEWEADEGGFAKLSEAGYDLAEAPKVYQALLDDRGEPKRAEAFFFGSHPRLSERVANTKEYLAGHPVQTAANPSARPDTFERRIIPVVRDNARLNIERGYFRLAENELERASEWMPEDPEIRFVMGLLRLAESDVEKDPENQRRLRLDAADAFREAIRLDADRPAPHRELGLLLYDQEAFREACTELGYYAELAPDADDAHRIEDYVLELRADGYCR
jgi:predicted Zn-dependent protease